MYACIYSVIPGNIILSEVPVNGKRQVRQRAGNVYISIGYNICKGFDVCFINMEIAVVNYAVIIVKMP